VRHRTLSERALVLAPHGRDAAIAAIVLSEADFGSHICPNLPSLVDQLNNGAGLVVVTEEALSAGALAPLSQWLDGQREWSDLPFILLTRRGGGLERNPTARRYLEVLGNVTFLERPFHPTTLVSLAHAALRGRRRQYEARARLEALQESEDHYRHAVELNPQVAWTARPDGQLDHVARRWFDWTGTTGLGASWTEGLHPDDRDRTLGAWRASIGTGEPYDIEHRVLMRDGGIRWARSSAFPRRDSDGAVIKWYGATQDIHDRKLVENRLAASEARFQAIANSIDQMIWSTRPDGYHDYFNQRWYDYTGVAPGTTDGGGWSELFHPDDQERAWALWRRSLATGEPYHIEYRLRHRSGRFRWVLGRAQCVRDEAGHIERWFGTCTDIQEIVEAREVLARSREELERLVGERSTKLLQAEEQLRQAQKMEAVGQLTGGVAHDFNNLLTIIRSGTDLLRRPNLPEERRRRYVDAISDTVDRAARLTGQLLAFARRQALKPEVFDAGERLHSVADMLRTVVGSRVRVTIERMPGPWYVKADVSQFETAFVNMAVNARDAMNGEGSLTIALATVEGLPAIRGHAGGPGKYVAISVTDSGVGIPPDKIEHIFEPFFTTKEVGKGTGLGLSQVYGFTKQSGGDIDVVSQPGKGARFTIYLPNVDAPNVEEIIEDNHERASGRPPGGRILVVEDNLEVGAFSTQLLQDLGYDTTWATSGDEALQTLSRSAGFDAVFTDVIMPGMSGIELGQSIRRLYPRLPVVLTSGYSHVLAEEGRHGFELLKKPYAAEELSRLLRKVIRNA
jgi:PAS domain S-box-containing protein